LWKQPFFQYPPELSVSEETADGHKKALFTVKLFFRLGLYQLTICFERSAVELFHVAADSLFNPLTHLAETRPWAVKVIK
jgi:hypothetical protein